MKKKRFSLIISSIIALALVTLAMGYLRVLTHSANQTTTTKMSPKHHHVTKQAHSEHQQHPAVDWRSPSEAKPYPDLTTVSNLWIKVSEAKQRVYLMDGDQTLYTMYCSTGAKDTPTPTGTFYIQAERGPEFYNQKSKEGAKNYVSFKDHGVYLFHSVPTDKAGNFIEAEAQELGHTANSHGCVRLSVADSEWFYNSIPEGTKVVIEK